MLYLTAISFGILSSFHCLGMCGPIALATPVIRKSEFTQFLSRLLYNLGRTTSYILIGLVAGLAGKGLYIAGIQQFLSVFAGSVLLLWIIIPRLNPENWKKLHNKTLLKKINTAIQFHFQQKKYSSIYMVGIFNGLLPCGMVYMALVGAMATGNMPEGGLYMLLFGIGTWPMFFALTAAWKYITLSRREKIKKLAPVFVTVIAVMFILRGMNLDIPYVSPKIQQENGQTITTCQK